MRQFLAIRIPEATRNALLSLQDRLRSRCPGWRWVKSSNLHLTVRFLGEVSETTDRAARPFWQRVVGEIEPFRLALGRLGSFPVSGRPRVLWVAFHELDGKGGLARLGDGIETAAREAGFAAARRPFRAHLTLARAARSGRAVLPQEVDPPETTPFDVRELILFESELNSAGASYTALATFALRGAGNGSP